MGRGEQQLGQGKGQQIVMPARKRQRGRPHVPHGDVEQGRRNAMDQRRRCFIWFSST